MPIAAGVSRREGAMAASAETACELCEITPAKPIETTTKTMTKSTHTTADIATAVLLDNPTHKKWLAIAAAVVLSCLTAIMSRYVVLVTFRAHAGDVEQREFKRDYERALEALPFMACIFDCRAISSFETNAVLAHIREIASLRSLHEQKMKGFAIMIESDLLRPILQWVFKLVPPVSPYIITADRRMALDHVLCNLLR